MHEDILTAKLSIIDDMSDTMAHIADIGLDMAGKLEQSGHTVSTAFDDMSSTASNAVSAMDAVSNSAENAANSTDHWTSAADKYNKSALESIYTTEELIDKGFKSSEALLEESNAAAQYDEALTNLYHEMEDAAYLQEALSEAIDNASDVMSRAIESDEVSADAKRKLSEANEEAAEAFADLEKAQTAAQAAIDDFDRAASAEILNADDLAAAAQRAATASDDLAEAQKRADKAAGDLAKATDKAAKGLKDFGDESEEGGKKALDAIEAVAETAAFAAIISYCKSAADSVYALAEAFSEAQQTIVNATGATDEALADMENSMMSAFGTHHADLNTTAGAIGEINTRMGLTGQKLTDVTGKFLDFSQATGSNTVTAVQNVTKVMNKWGVEQEDVVDVLDKLAYAGQISGASVDSLSSQLINGAASFKAMGLSLDTTISLLSAFELQGINSSSAIMGLRTAARKFAADGLEANDALKDTIEKISTLKNESEATSLAVKVFGSRAGLEMAGAIRNGAITVEMLNSDLEIAEGTLKKTTEAGETLSEKWDKASNKFKTAFTNATQPALNGISDGLANIVGSIGDFLAEHETLTKVLTAGAVTIGAIAAGISGLTFAVNTAIPIIVKFGSTIAAVATAHPVLVAITGIAALAAGIATFIATTSDAEKEVEDYNGTLEECSREIETTRLAHERAVSAYTAESNEAKRLGEQLDLLNAQYQKGGGFAEDYAQRVEESAKAFNEFQKDYTDKITAIEDTTISGLVVASQLETLSKKANKTNADLNLMGKYADYLNNTFECNIKVNYKTGSLTGFDPVGQFQKNLKAKSDAQKIQVAIEKLADPNFQQEYVDDLNKIKALERQIKLQQPGLVKDIENIQAVNSYNQENGISANDAFKSFESKYKSNDPNRLYDFEKYYNEHFNKSTGSAFADSVITFMAATGDTIGRWFGDEEVAAADTFTSDYSEYAKNVDSLNTLKKQIEDKNSQIAQLHKDAGAKGGEEAYIKNLENTAKDTGNSVNSLSDYIGLYKDGINDVTDAQTDFEKALTTTDEVVKAASTTYTKALEDGKLSTSEMTDLINELPSEAGDAVKKFGDSLIALQEEYQQVYAACKQSFEGQFGLFDEAKADSDKTIWAWQKAQETQLDYWKTYDTNINYLSSLTADKLGLTKQEFEAFKLGLDDLKQKVASGDTEIAGLMSSIKYNIEEGDKQAAVSTVTNQGKLKAERDKTAEDTAHWVDDLDKKMQEAYKKAQESVQNMQTIGPEARTIAMDIMAKYAQGIERGGQTAINTAANIAKQVKNALDVSANVSVSMNGPVPSFEANAAGTLDSADVFIAGEQGPELIVGKQHSTVFPTSETDKILNAVNGTNISEQLESVFIPILGKTVNILDNFKTERAPMVIMPNEDNSNADNRNASSRDKKITIELNGSGNIKVSKGADKKEVLSLLEENLKPVLMNIISTEIYEEGDDSYEY